MQQKNVSMVQSNWNTRVAPSRSYLTEMYATRVWWRSRDTDATNKSQSFSNFEKSKRVHQPDLA